MGPGDLLRLTLRTLAAHRLRSALTMIGIVVGISSVVLLTSIGEGVRLYIVEQFTQFGTNLIGVTPGKMETWGIPGFLGGTTRKLTVGDARALARVPGVKNVLPVAYGMARIERDGRGRRVYVYGVTSAMPQIFHMAVRSGRFLPEEEIERPSPVCVLGPTLKQQLFGGANALGERVRIGGASFRVIGIMEKKGTFLGIDIDDTAYVPLQWTMDLFNRDELNEIDVQLARAEEADAVAERITEVLRRRHEGDVDFTVTTQAAMLSTAGRILGIITAAVTGIAAISLFVGAMGILTILWVSVHERTEEIGLSLAIGATRAQIAAMFLAEAATLSTLGGIVGVLVGFGAARGLEMALPGMPARPIPEMAALALAVSLAVGLLAGVIPALRAARLDPIEALRAE
jgi:putative ABC transport system permease protein